MTDEDGAPGARESPRQRVERLVREGSMPSQAIETAERLWQERLKSGIALANGTIATITKDDLYHLIVDDRIWRRPERIEWVLHGIFEIRTAREGRRTALSQWREDERTLFAWVILSAEGRVWTMHVVDGRKLRREQLKGELVWKRSPHP